MYLRLERKDIQDDYKHAARRIEERFKIKPTLVDAIPLNSSVIQSIDDTTAVVGAYGGLYLPKFRGLFFRTDEVILTCDKVLYRRPDAKIGFHPVTKEFSPNILLYGSVGDLGRPSDGARSSIDDDMLMRKFGIHAANLRNLLQIGQNGSFSNDGLYTILINEERLNDAFKKGSLHREPAETLSRYAAK